MKTEDIVDMCNLISRDIDQLHVLIKQHNKSPQIAEADRINSYQLRDVRHGIEDIKAEATATLQK